MLLVNPFTYWEFQSTSPVRGTTANGAKVNTGFVTFQSTSPVRGTTQPYSTFCTDNTISIHVPREGDDHVRRVEKPGVNDFNPRPP